MKLHLRDARIWLVFGALVISVLWLFFEPYPSHYLSGLRFLGDLSTQNYWGSPKEGRGDEWSTYLPMLKQALLEGFPVRSGLEPYREKLNWFIAIPKADFSLVFLPNYLMYWVASPGKALSFQGIYYYLLFIFSLIWYLRNLTVGTWIAVCAAVSLGFSHLYQVWWTSNFPALAAVFLPFAILTSRLPWLVRVTLLFWSVGHLAFGEMYPPFYFSVAVALVPITFAIRPDLLRWKFLIGAAIATLAALAAYWLWASDFIVTVANTSYPGQRFNMGGGSSYQALLAMIFPTMPVNPMPGADATYELSVAGTILPLIFIASLPNIKWDNNSIRVTFVAFIVGAILTIYAVIGFPHILAKYSGFFLVPGRRIHIGISILVIVYAAYMISRNIERTSLSNLFSVFFIFALLSAAIGVRAGANSEFLIPSSYAYFPIVLMAFGILIFKFRSKKINISQGAFASYSVMVGMAVAHVFIFGAFNPIMRASDILGAANSQLLKDWKALYEKNNQHSFAIKGNFGHLLRGEGLPALEAIHLANVDDAVYKALFPELSAEERSTYFNRFLGIGFDNLNKIDPRGATFVFPLHENAVPFVHEIKYRTEKNASNLLMQEPVSIVNEAPQGTGYSVYWTGVLNKPVGIDRKFFLALPCHVKNSWLTRSPIPEVNDSEDGVSLRLLSGKFDVDNVDNVGKDQALACAKNISVAVD
ncbi:hypothetical protein [Delftia sp. HK171]|uniref:DUF7657 domain-containing protein n=1 Tax=Delftia sp. HK171 TaxID=1920191 RepID=UPI0011530BBE|nr:hypothetical protein [Delftia sp. HK171]TQL65496.1 hypothetical protein FB549_5219 [Delftia sp. HK171]